MTGRIVGELSFSRDRKPRLTIELTEGFRGFLDKLESLSGKPLNLQISVQRKRRSLNANAYFNVLVNKIAESQGISDMEVKRQLVLDYGTLETDESGQIVGAMLPATANVEAFHPYAKWYKDMEVNGKPCKCYLFYKRTHTLDTKEMARLIDGACYEAECLGIETMTPEQLAMLDGYKEARK